MAAPSLASVGLTDQPDRDRSEFDNMQKRNTVTRTPSPRASIPSLTAALVLLANLIGCATHVEVESAFPRPVTHALPLNAALVLEPEFRNYRFETDEGKEVSIAVGATQAELFTTLSAALFQSSRVLHTLPDDKQLDLVLRPKVEDVQISMPMESQLKVYEVWIKYNLQVFDGDGELIADWIMSAYGKTPTRFLKSGGEALHQASTVALRDAGAHFITTFARVPEIRNWLEQRSAATPATPGASGGDT